MRDDVAALAHLPDDVTVLRDVLVHGDARAQLGEPVLVDDWDEEPVGGHGQKRGPHGVEVRGGLLPRRVGDDADMTTAWALELDFDDVDTLPLGAPFAAGSDEPTRIIALATATLPQGDETICARLVSPFPEDEGPCAEAHWKMLASPMSLDGEVTLTMKSSALVGEVRAEVVDEGPVRGTFSEALVRE
jgi:hypothetical protein